jgi:hypothetical protein
LLKPEKLDRQDKEVSQLAVAAYAAWVLERTIKTLKEAGATSEETAKTPKELELDEKWLKMSANTIIPSGVVITKEGRYYLIGKNEKQQ